MTGPGGFRAEPDRLIAHADELAGIAVAVRGSRPTADALSPDAYGLVGGLFAASATGAMGRGALAVTDLAAALRGAADRLRACAQEYQRVEAAAAERFAGIEVPGGGPGDTGPHR